MKKHRLTIILLALTLLLSLVGCVNVGTTMTVDESFKGQRVITLSFDAQLMQTEGVLGDMDTHISDAKPAEMEFYRTDSENPIEYVFTIEFSSLEDYRSKIESITGRDVSVEFSYVNEPYSRDIKLVEDFDSSELFLWFEQVLESQREAIETAMGTTVNFDQLWKLSGYTLELAGENFTSSNSKISYSHGGGDLVTGINITTVIHGDEQYTRYIEYELSSEGSEVDRTDVIERLTANLPEGASISQTASAEGTSCTVSFSAGSTQLLADMTTQALDNKRATASWGDVDDLERPLTTLCGLEETFDLSSFSTDSDLNFTYCIESESGLTDNMYSRTATGLTELDVYMDSQTMTYTSNGTSFNLYSVLASVSQAQSISYGLVVEDEDSFIREIRITLPESSQTEVTSNIEQYYANRGAANTQIITSGSADLPYVLITIKGTAAEICAAEDILFGVSSERRLSYTREGGLFKVKPDATLTDSYDISSLLSLTGVSEYIYVVHTGDTVYKCSLGEDSNFPTENPVAVRCSSGAQLLSFTGTYVNSDAIIFICLLVVLVLLLAALAVTLYLQAKAEKEQEEQKNPAELTEGEQVKALPESDGRNFMAVMEDPEPIVPTSPVEIERYEVPESLPEPEKPSEDMLGIFTGADLGEEEYQPEAKEEPVQIELIPVETEPKEESQPEPMPEPEPEPEKEPQPEPDPYADYEDRFPMENLPPVVQSPENSTDKYSDSDFISDLRYLGYLDEYTKRKASRVKVKVKKKDSSRKVGDSNN